MRSTEDLDAASGAMPRFRPKRRYITQQKGKGRMETKVRKELPGLAEKVHRSSDAESRKVEESAKPLGTAGWFEWLDYLLVAPTLNKK